MTEWEQEVLQRLTQLEVEVSGMRRELKGFKTKVVTVATALGAFVAGLISFFTKGH